MIAFERGRPERPRTWRYKVVNNLLSAGITCPNGHRGDLGHTEVHKSGEVQGEIICGHSGGCSFADRILLKGWQSLSLKELPGGKKVLTFYKAHNRFNDSERKRHFLHVFDMIPEIFLDAIDKHGADPFNWVPEVLEQTRFLCLDYKLAKFGRTAGLHIPAPDEDGLVNWVTFMDWNPSLFPTVTNALYRRGFDSGELGRPSLIQLAN